MGKQNRYPSELRERGVRLVFGTTDEHGFQWAAIRSVAEKIGCTADSVRSWVRQAEKDQGKRAGLSSSEKEGMKELERKKRELRRGNAILREATAYFAQAELDRRRK